MKGFFQLPALQNEPVYAYAPGSADRQAVEAVLKRLKDTLVEAPLYIGSEEIHTEDKGVMSPPHNHKHILGYYSKATEAHVQQAIAAALEAKKKWEMTPWEDRAAIFLRAADLISGPYRAEMNATTMLAQSKTVHQSEIDAVCELADFWRFNVKYMTEIYAQQPESNPGMWNRLEYRPLEGFVFAITPFNFTSIAGNLPTAPALMGNVAVWKAANSQIYSANLIMRILKEAGLPDGVINLVHGSGRMMGDIIFSHPEFAGLHFTGSTGVFQQLWKTIGNNIDTYKSYPRIVGETGGKDFVIAHPSADPIAVATALSRGAFEFQGQKCSAASRAYLPKSMASDVLNRIKADVMSFNTPQSELEEFIGNIIDESALSRLSDLVKGKMRDEKNHFFGNPEKLSTFFAAVIDEAAFDKIAAYIEGAKADPDVEVIIGGGYDKSTGYFIEPTVLVSKNPQSTTMCEEIFGPVLTVYIYDDAKWHETLQLVDQTSPYGLTGAVFSRDRYAAREATDALRNAAGNFYVNDKPTGAVVNQQPFGGARASGTNDKAGSYLNLLRWVSARTIKETFVPPTDYRYPFMG